MYCAGKSLALFGIEHGIAFEEGDFPFAFLTTRVDLGALDAVGIDNQFASLAAANIAAQLQGLLEGQPMRAGIAFRHGGGPQHDNVDAIIRNAVVPQRASDFACRMFHTPRLQPGANPLFQIRDNLVRDPGINIRTA